VGEDETVAFDGAVDATIRNLGPARAVSIHAVERAGSPR